MGREDDRYRKPVDRDRDPHDRRDKKRDRSRENSGKHGGNVDRNRDKKYDRGSRGNSGKYHHKYNNEGKYKRSRSRSKDKYQKKEPVKLPETFVQDELDKWRNLINKASNSDGLNNPIASVQLSKVVEDFINKENQELDAISEEDLLDIKKREEKKIEEARARRKALMEKLNQTNPSSPPPHRIPEEAPSKHFHENDGDLEAIENDLENMADFEVHDQHGTIIQPERPEFHMPSSPQSEKKKSKKVYDMFEDSGSSEEYQQDSQNRPKDRHTDFDDDEQYYRAQVGEVFHEAFKVVAIMGKGMFGSVVKAQEIDTDRMVAIKVDFNYPDFEVCRYYHSGRVERN